ncbi:hypothetical protein [Schaalia vaccimaxillae]|uniref:hypothetical protein n=1 Tax=Schaalia vaccimaxillae TaxID=183916 RepID=UPI0003B4E4DF|nr:hypothetical protein [Schaalia vaccimaxillae]
MRGMRSRLMTRKGLADDDGRIGMLLVACVGVVVVFVLISMAVTSVAIQDRRLIACADRASSAAAGAIDGDSFYIMGADELVLSESGAVASATSAVEIMSDSSCSVGAGVEIIDTVIVGNEVFVTLRAQSVLPGLPRGFSGVAAPILERTSSSIIR